jgi:hypothetical protein
MLGEAVPVALAWLIVTLLHQEALPGDRQFWLTRPYRIGSLMAAKALFVLLFVCASLVAKDCYIVAAHGLPIGLTGLLLRLIAWTAWVVLPALAVGVITRNLQEVVLVGAGIGAVYALQGFLKPQSVWTGIEWVPDYLGILLLLVGCGAIVLWQYLLRRTGTARAAVACCSVMVLMGVPLLPWGAAFAIQMAARPPRPDVANAQILPGVLQAHVPAPAGDVIRDRLAGILLPLRVTGVNGPVQLAEDGFDVQISSGTRVVWHSGWQTPRYGNGTTWQLFALDEATYRRLENLPVTIRLSLAVTFFEDLPSTPVPHLPKFSLDGARCEQRSPLLFPWSFWCETAFKELPSTRVVLKGLGTLGSIGTQSYAPYPAVLDMDPMTATVPAGGLFSWGMSDAVRVVTVTSSRPVAHLRRDVEFANVRLADYALRRWWDQRP